MSYKAAHELGILWGKTVDQITAIDAELASGRLRLYTDGFKRETLLKSDRAKLEARLKRIETGQLIQMERGDD